MNNTNYKQQFEEEGFLLLPGLISSEDAEHYKALLESDYNQYANLYMNTKTASEGSLANKSGEKVVFNLHNKDISWFKLFDHPEVLKILDVALKQGSYNNAEPYYLNNISARCPLKGHLGQQLHIDSNIPGLNQCIVVNVLWLLDDFSIDNGATRVVPGSHKWQKFAPDGKTHPDEVSIVAPKGSALVFNAGLWHGGAENMSGESRWAVALGYARWFIKPSFDYMRNTPEDIYDSLSDKQKDLLGFRLQPPKDEFTRLRRRSDVFERPKPYQLPKTT